MTDPRDHRAVALFEERYGVVRAGRGLDGLADLIEGFGRLPYENLSKILAWRAGTLPPTPRFPEQVMEDHLALGTGGTCFSLTELLRQLVASCGLEASPVMAHMKHGSDIHCALQVELRGRPYLLDPGYLVGRPLPLEASSEADWRVGEGRLLAGGTIPGVPDTGGLDLFTMEPEGPRWRYRLAARPAGPDAFERRWLESFHLPGMRSLVVTRRGEDGDRLYLHNHKLRIRGANRRVNENVRATLDATVEQLFGIDAGVVAAARELLERRRREQSGGDAPGA
jgi:arylamine N-acetyltransferase